MLRRNLIIYGAGGIIIPFVVHQGHRSRPRRAARLLMESWWHLRRAVALAALFPSSSPSPTPSSRNSISQLFFKYQAQGSLNSYGSTLVGQNWSQTTCGSHPRGSCVFQGRPDDLGPYSSGSTSPAGHPGDDPLVANGQSGNSGATNLGPRSAKLVAFTKQLVAYWHRAWVSTRRQPRHDVGQRRRPRHQ